jgi:hypothetical protein
LTVLECSSHRVLRKTVRWLHNQLMPGSNWCRSFSYTYVSPPTQILEFNRSNHPLRPNMYLQVRGMLWSKPCHICKANGFSCFFAGSNFVKRSQFLFHRRLSRLLLICANDLNEEEWLARQLAFLFCAHCVSAGLIQLVLAENRNCAFSRAKILARDFVGGGGLTG